jgi:hypothetical protein
VSGAFIVARRMSVFQDSTLGCGALCMQTAQAVQCWLAKPSCFETAYAEKRRTCIEGASHHIHHTIFMFHCTVGGICVVAAVTLLLLCRPGLPSYTPAAYRSVYWTVQEDRTDAGPGFQRFGEGEIIKQDPRR